MILEKFEQTDEDSPLVSRAAAADWPKVASPPQKKSAT